MHTVGHDATCAESWQVIKLRVIRQKIKTNKKYFRL